MRCFICDKALKEEQTVFNRDHEEWDPCPECLIAISEVFSNDDEETISEALEEEQGEVLPFSAEHAVRASTGLVRYIQQPWLSEPSSYKGGDIGNTG